MIVYLLPTRRGFTLWSPADWKIGELGEKMSKCALLIPKGVDVEPHIQEIKDLIHDYFYRFQSLRLPKRYASTFWFRMLWGILALLALRSPTEDLAWGIYLLLANPIFVNAIEARWQSHVRGEVLRCLDASARFPDLRIIESEQLARLTAIVKESGEHCTPWCR